MSGLLALVRVNEKFAKSFLLGETVALFGGLGSLKEEREGGVTVDCRSKTENESFGGQGR